MSSLIDVLLGDPDEGLRAVAANALADITVGERLHPEREVVVGALKSALADPSREVQAAADRALSRLVVQG